jgi:hypothetical protein
MTRIGVAGHQDLPHAAIDYITQGIRGVLAQYDHVIGYSSLAAGADQLFATEVLDGGGQLHVVIPSAGYTTTLDGDAAALYKRLLASASGTTQLPFPAPGEDAYEAAGQWIATESELLIAVWDGLPARGRGGTADTVAHACELDREVRVIWPAGMTRS